MLCVYADHAVYAGKAFHAGYTLFRRSLRCFYTYYAVFAGHAAYAAYTGYAVHARYFGLAGYAEKKDTLMPLFRLDTLVMLPTLITPSSV